MVSIKKGNALFLGFLREIKTKHRTLVSLWTERFETEIRVANYYLNFVKAVMFPEELIATLSTAKESGNDGKNCNY